jgi:pimeloyl-ACP methyl ester carboxylesterase
MRHITLLIAIFALLGGCASREPLDPAYFEIEAGRLPSPDVALSIPGLGPCTDNPDRSLRLDSTQPVNVLVHGCFGSSGQFRGLAQVLAFHGQQSACFTYDDRAALTRSATDLRAAVNQLTAQTRLPRITVIGHSQGALIARKSLTEPALAPPHQAGPQAELANLRLVTISGPFAGIAAAQTCGRTWLYPLTLGFLPATCYLATGAKWADITYSSQFILEPGALAPQVSNYLKIDTDERGSCRRETDGRCLEADEVFSLSEQHSLPVEADARTQRVEARAGHVEIVGDKRVAPIKLIAILQRQGVLHATAPERQSALGLLLARVYQDDALLATSALKGQ